MSLLPTREITEDQPYNVLFVCLGNICRSPTGEGVMQHLVNEAGLQNYFLIDSAGTSAWHAGEPANSKSRSMAEKYGVSLLSRSRQVTTNDMDSFDLILAMDTSNEADLKSIAQSEEQRANIKRMRFFDPNPEDGDVPDPYYGGLKGFDNVFKMVERSCKALLHELKPMIKK